MPGGRQTFLLPTALLEQHQKLHHERGKPCWAAAQLTPIPALPLPPSQLGPCFCLGDPGSFSAQSGNTTTHCPAVSQRSTSPQAQFSTPAADPRLCETDPGVLLSWQRVCHRSGQSTMCDNGQEGAGQALDAHLLYAFTSWVGDLGWFEGIGGP